MDVTYEVRVQYKGQLDTARFLHNGDDEEAWQAAMATARTLQRLPATKRVWINRVTVTNLYSWESGS